MLTMVEAGRSSDSGVWLFPREDIQGFIGPLWRLVEKYPADMLTKYTPEAVAQMIYSQSLDLWVGVNKGHITIAGLAFFDTYPLCKDYRFLWIGGTGMKPLFQVGLNKIEYYAYCHGAQRVIVEGRSKWARILARQGYEPYTVSCARNVVRKWGH